MGMMGTEKGSLETNSTVTSYRVRCSTPACTRALESKPVSMTVLQRELAAKGWVYDPGTKLWHCASCAPDRAAEKEKKAASAAKKAAKAKKEAEAEAKAEAEKIAAENAKIAEKEKVEKEKPAGMPALQEEKPGEGA